MAHVHQRNIWGTDRSDVTPESVYQNRRTFLKRAAESLGTVGLLAAQHGPAWALDQDDELRRTLRPVKGSAFQPGKRNPKYKVNRPITKELDAARYNNFYEFGTDKEQCWRQAQKLTVRPWTIEIGGLVAKKKTFAIDELLRKIPCEERVYRFRCVERWAMVVPWSGFPFKALLDLVEPLSKAKFVRMLSFHRPAEAIGQRPGSPWHWPYYEGITIAEAANPLAFVATGIYGHDLPRQHGAPLRMVLPWKYGFKGTKSIVKIEFVQNLPRTFWHDSAPQEYGFYSNINPEKPHPRWSQKTETMIGTGIRHKTVIYNGYGEFVGPLYRGNEY